MLVDHAYICRPYGTRICVDGRAINMLSLKGHIHRYQTAFKSHYRGLISHSNLDQDGYPV
jgi:hypothetical protein